MTHPTPPLSWKNDPLWHKNVIVQVVKAVTRVMRFGLDMGVDSLRLDAIPFIHCGMRRRRK